MNWLYYILLLATMVIGLLVNLLGLPGLWLMVAGVAGYGLLTGMGTFVGWQVLVVLLVLALVAEVVEFFAGSVGAKNAGAGRLGMTGAVIGAFIGALVATPLIPVPIVGTVVGACLGAFVGAAGLEIILKPDLFRALRIGFGAAKGRLLGIVLKSTFGGLIFLIAAIDALPLR